MSAIHLNGNEWIVLLYASVSESYEGMIGYTTDLGKCLRVICPTHIFRVLRK